MPRFSVPERYQIATLYYDTKNACETARVATERFGRPVSEAVVRYQIKKISQRYCLHDQHKLHHPGFGQRSGRERFKRTEENVLKVIAALGGAYPMVWT